MKKKGKPRGMNYAFEKLRRMSEDVSRIEIRYYGKLKID